MSAKEYREKFRWPNKLKPYAMILCHEDVPVFLIEGVNWSEDTLQGEFLTSSEPAELKISDLSNYTLEIEHIIKNRGIVFDGAFDFLFNKITQFKYIKSALRNRKVEKEKCKFEKTKLILKSRMEILEFFVEHFCKGGKPMTLQKIMSATVHNRWVFHPDSKHKQQRLSLLLDSLVLSGDLLSDSNKLYRVSPKSIVTIEEYREGNVKHRQVIILQKNMLIVTAILAVFSVFQSGIIKFATIIDLDKHKMITGLVFVLLFIVVYVLNNLHNKQINKD
jgi:hypothetical protein